MPLDVLLVTGCIPPIPCGVGHYTVRLRKALEHHGVRAGLQAVSHRGDLTVLGARIHNEQPQIVHLMYPSRGYRRSLFPLRIPGLVRPARLFLGLHEYRAAHPLRRFFIRRLAQSAWKISVSTRAEQAALSRHETHLVPIPSPLIDDPDALHPPTPPTSATAPLKVSFFGFVNPRKGVDTLIEACLGLQKTGRDCALDLIGQTPPEFAAYTDEIIRSAQQRGLSIHRFADLPDPEVLERLRRSDLCILPFTGGASGRHTTLVTALQAGVPVITTQGPDVPQGMLHEVHAWLVPPGQPEPLTQAMETLARDPERRRVLSHEGRRLAAAWSWKNVAAEFARLYEIPRLR